MIINQDQIIMAHVRYMNVISDETSDSLYPIVSGKPCRLEAEGKKKVFHRRDEGGGCNGDIKV